MAPHSPLTGPPVPVRSAGLAAIVALAAWLPAQKQFDELGKRHLPDDDAFALAIAAGDFDGDGLGDLVLGNSNARNRLYLGDGRGVFVDATAGRMPFDDDVTVDLAAGDVDGDGDLDLVVANNGEQNGLYINDGTGAFADAAGVRLPPDSDFTQAVALGDVDGDGDLDLALGNAGAPSRRQNRLYVNDGAGRFTDVTATRMPVDGDVTLAVALGDLDGDGDLDLVTGNSGPTGQRRTKLYINDGAGAFTDATAARMPADDDFTSAVSLGDVDADGDLDLVLGSSGVNPRPQTRLYLNDGTGTFADVTAARMPIDGDSSTDLALGDLDGDGDPDLLIGNSGPAGQRQDRLYLNDGTGTFSDATAAAMPADDTATSAVAMSDADGDGDRDLVLGGALDRLFLNDGSGGFVNASVRPLPPDDDSTRGVVLNDVDGDGDLDALLASFAAQNRLYLNDGNGSFVDDTVARMPPDGDRSTAAATGDVDGDGDLDVVFGNVSQQDRLYLNDGTGTFADATAQRMPIDSDTTNALLLADVDGDGDLDLVRATGGEQDRLYVNDGSGRFADATAARMPIRQSFTNALAPGDVDGDGDGDLVLGAGGLPGERRTRLYLNDGAGVFFDATQGRMPFDDDLTFAVALGDVDGDGDLDLVTGNAPRSRLYLNDGTGRFTDATAARMPANPGSTRAVGLDDVDVDGDLDLVLATLGPPAPTRLYVNDGSGFFADASSRMPTHRDVTLDLAFGDVDGDGDRDLVFANAIANRVYLNLRRQLSTPFLARLGELCRLDGYARFGPPGGADVVLPFVSDMPARMALPPFGTLRLEPSRLVALPPFLVARPAGVGSVSFVIPDLPGLLGESWHAQAMLIELPSAGTLTDSTTDVIVDV